MVLNSFDRFNSLQMSHWGWVQLSGLFLLLLCAFFSFITVTLVWFVLLVYQFAQLYPVNNPRSFETSWTFATLFFFFGWILKTHECIGLEWAHICSWLLSVTVTLFAIRSCIAPHVRASLCNASPPCRSTQWGQAWEQMGLDYSSSRLVV